MYFNKKNKFPHGIMFHQFHDTKFYKASDGSISANDLYDLIKFIGRKNIINADSFVQKKLENKLKNNELCFTFDDGLKCQLKIALPVLEDLRIKSFFFVNTSIFEGKPDFLELTRFFRVNYFKNKKQFYDLFFELINGDYLSFLKKNSKIIEKKKTIYPFYSTRDLEFRLIRDRFFNQDQFKKIIFKMFKIKNFISSKTIKKLFFSKLDLKNLDSKGHLIGLHSHSHVSHFGKLPIESQKNEYKKNRKVLSDILNKPCEEIISMSHPLGSYNKQSLEVLKNINIQIGFRDNMCINRGMKKINNSNLELARQDHSLIMKNIKK